MVAPESPADRDTDERAGLSLRLACAWLLEPTPGAALTSGRERSGAPLEGGTTTFCSTQMFVHEEYASVLSVGGRVSSMESGRM